jgi:hypothetical protein
MKLADPAVIRATSAMPNGSGAAAVLAAGMGCFALGVLAIAGDKSAFVKSLLVFYKPTGPLSGVNTMAILVWLLAWGILEVCWRKKSVDAARICIFALLLLGLGFLLTFPPIADIF